MSYPLYVVFGILPSIIWLIYYLRKDIHPEPKKLILKVFFWGMLAALPAILLEVGTTDLIKKLGPPLVSDIVYWFIGVALVEEFLKFLVVRDKVLKNPEFNEPVDAMVYMIISALGFAASENILIFLSQRLLFFNLETTLTLFIFRFLSATFLHALASAAVGYFLALSFFEKRGLRMVGLGLGISTLLHGLYNFSIMESGGNLKIIIPLVILIALAIFVSWSFKKLKKLVIIKE
jgi:RsiW-degrading membrane proteinase PrsW (M82 family)